MFTRVIVGCYSRWEFDNCEVSVDSKSVQEMLGLPSGGSLLSNMDYISENNEESCMFECKKQYENIDKLRMKQLKNELVQSSAADDNFKINFLGYCIAYGTDVIGFRANYEIFFKKTNLHVSVLDSWSRILNHQEKFRDVVNSPLRLFMNSDTERAFEVIDNGADDADFDDKYGAVFKPLICSKDLLCSMEIIFLSNGGRVLGVSYNLYENLARNMKNKNLGKWGT
ncbi:unnamed protein product [Lactuca virosa]|uniref:Uncharacterized protein n=1 Tax=Lactuca virosa TaxID=75947 RepID=A0AAU9P956_9ASTR|nr:unnamed protein product [Lactuca virosa]